jgi:hypothetical protein
VRIEEMECLPGIEERISHGWPLKKVAAWVKEQGAGAGFSSETLVTALVEYRKAMPPSKLAQHSLPSLHQEAAEQVAQGLNVLDELQKLYEIQRDRVDIDYTIEKNLKKLFKTTHKEVKEAREILVAYAQVQMDLGLTERHLGKVKVEGPAPVQVEDPAVAGVLESPRKRQKVLAVFDRIAALTERLEEGDSEPVPVEQAG